MDRVATTAPSKNTARTCSRLWIFSQNCYRKREWLKVKYYSHHALSILEQVPILDDINLAHNWQRLYRIQLGQYQLLLTQSHLHLQELESAANLIELTIANFNLNDEPKLYIRLLDTFHDIATAQGRYLQAFQTRQQQRSLEQQYGLRAFIGAGILQPKQLSPNPNVAELNTSKFDVNAIEIAASGRTKDVNHLVERVLSIDHQLTVIHGESGVGKSSLVNAGLIPALLQRSSTVQELLPIKIRTYTSWINAIALAIYTSQYLDNGDQNSIKIPQSPNGYHDRRKNGDRDITTLLHKLKQLAAHGTQIVLIFDQFEEFFLLIPNHQKNKFLLTFGKIVSKFHR